MMAEKDKKASIMEDKEQAKAETSLPQKTVSGISGTKTLRVGRVNKKAKKPPVEEEKAPVETVAKVEEVKPVEKVEKPVEQPAEAPKKAASEKKVASEKKTTKKASVKKDTEDVAVEEVKPAPKAAKKETVQPEEPKKEEVKVAPKEEAPVAPKEEIKTQKEEVKAKQEEQKPASRLSSAVVRAPSPSNGNGYTRETSTFVRSKDGNRQGQGSYNGGQRNGSFQRRDDRNNGGPRQGGSSFNGNRGGNRNFGGFTPKDKDDDEIYNNNHNQPKRSSKPKQELPPEATKEKANFAARDAYEKSRKDPKADSKKDNNNNGKSSNNNDRRMGNKRANQFTGNASDILSDDSALDSMYMGGKNKKKVKRQTFVAAPVAKPQLTHVSLPPFITVKELAEGLEKRSTDIIKTLMMMGMLVTLNQELDYDTAALVAQEYGITAEPIVEVTEEDILFDESEDNEENLKPRPPIVVVMGHVDHGKTSLLDKIRQTSVVKGEAGGITQHIGAYTVRCKGRQITFLDTPGHEAFTTMRARGAQVTDIAILVVAADDGVMPQTIEAINHARAANTEIIVAITKIDKVGANIDHVKQELSTHNLLPEEWGGSTIMVPVSSKSGEGIDELLEMVLLTADVMELKADPKRQAKGTVIEAKLDKNRGPVATVLVQRGTLRSGDTVVSGPIFGHIRAMYDENGTAQKKAGPSVPVEILGLPEVPEAGETFYAVTDEKMARQLVEKRKIKQREEQLHKSSRMTLETLSQVLAEGEVKDLNLIIKADVQGSVEAVTQSLEKLTNDEVRVKVIHGGVGTITESDVTLADVSNAIIIGFNVRPSAVVVEQAKGVGVDIKLYSVIYNAIEDIEAAMRGMLKPQFEEVVLGHVEIRQTFKVSSVGTIGGAYVTDGKILRTSEVRVVRKGIVLHQGKLASLKRFKDDAKEVAAGYECGISIENYNDIEEGDVIEVFEMQEIKRK
ncbi:MAG: translation initiation factor IF-2 [Clostridiales bacterium]|nr:translation initiation factor IF-2 [Candidatus Scatonaster coprocaballi]